MSTIAENAAAVKAAQVAIDAAIVAKGGTTQGGLTNAAAAIAAIPSGGGIDPQFVADCFGRRLTGDWDVTLPENSQLSAYAIANNTTNFSITIRGVKEVYDNAFRSSKVTSVSLPDVIIARGYAFYNCTSLHTVRLSNPNAIQNLFRIDAGSVLSDVYFSGKTAAQIIATTGFPGYSGTSQQPNEENLTFHGTDADVKLVGGAWTIVERN